MENPQPRRSFELVFSFFMFGASLFLFYTAYGISGFEALSAPGGVPMMTTGLMTVTSGMVLIQTLRKPAEGNQWALREILPLPVVLMTVLITAYAFMLKPLGFIPTSFLFLVIGIRILTRRNWGWTVMVSAFSILLIWVIFRLIFSVLMPAGIVPEAEILAFFRKLMA